jgi:hypothetical protein
MIMNNSNTCSLRLPGKIQEKSDLLITGVSASGIVNSFTFCNQDKIKVKKAKIKNIPTGKGCR